MGKIARLDNNKSLSIAGELIENNGSPPSLYFDGKSQALTIPNTSNRLQPSNTFTWEMWFKLDGYTQYDTLMGFTLNNFDFARMDSTTSLKCHIRDSNGSAAYVNLEGTPSVDDGEWHHMAIVWDGINGRRWGFLDGVQRHYSTMAVGTNVGSTSSYGSFAIGGATPTSRLIKGWIKEVRMWQVARTQQEIVNDMDTKLVGNEDGLFLYLPLNEGKERTIIDKASGYVADLGGAIWQGDNKIITLTNSGNMEVYGEYIEGNKNSIQSGRLELMDIIEGGV